MLSKEIRMKPVILIFAMLIGFILQACGAVVLPTLAMLNGMSPLTADPAGFEVAVAMPEGADVPDGAATFTLEMTRSDTGEAFDRDFVLQRRAAADGRILFRVNPADLDELRTLQARAVAWEAEDPDAASGSISVGVTACAKGDGPAEDARFSVSIRTQVDGAFMPLIRDTLVSEVIEEVETLNDTSGATICE
jgi:hypothetical protein